MAPAPARLRFWAEVTSMGAAAALGLGLTAYAALRTVRGQRLDQAAMDAVAAGPEGLRRVIGLLGTISLWSTVVGLAVCLGLALLRGRLAAAVGAVVLVAGADMTTQVLKRWVFERSPDLSGLPPSLPSGHTTVALSLGLAALVVTSGPLRALLVPLVAAAATLVGGGTVIGGWHRPADVLAATAVCLAWSAVALAVAGVVGRTSPRARSAQVGVSGLMALGGAAAVGVVFLLWGVRPAGGWSDLPLAATALGSIGVAMSVTAAWVGQAANRLGL
jgi:hypothetical protein